MAHACIVSFLLSFLLFKFISRHVFSSVSVDKNILTTTVNTSFLSQPINTVVLVDVTIFTVLITHKLSDINHLYSDQGFIKFELVHCSSLSCHLSLSVLLWSKYLSTTKCVCVCVCVCVLINDYC